MRKPTNGKAPPSPRDSGKSSLERTADLTRRLLAVSKAEIGHKRRAAKRKK
jgi:hypothetical protein